MSRVAKQILNTEGVEIIQKGLILNFKGKFGVFDLKLHPEIIVNYNKEEKTIGVIGEAEMALRGTFVRLIQNGIIGTSVGFSKQIKLSGVGYKASIEGKSVKLNIGLSHTVSVAIPDEVKVDMPNIVTINLKSANKELLGIIVDRFCKTKKYNVYNGNGVLEVGKYYRRKETKKK
jgi:large subunit ribosomal protein L6